MAVPPGYSATAAVVPLRNGRVVCVDRIGAIRWTAKVTGTASPAAGDGLVFVATADAIEAFRETDGGAGWRLPLERP